ncbi:MAG: chemotaxis response regulator protein-glutamate methylesterase [Paludibacterium sp.]|uniref:protein-glutamate methylesterase/protein-glutamine glutaminase n=1 Tax=Paludibacterium sp. TaxID=1917523 RepID=UPI0025D76BFE|nr:chemotaxis response regulator protein-glutamate methylesterase [Paludibacterium sp.]MBV8047512.1 chemotaxis response regulator protein-glutamate methylesterase [Paludibacterium sp.]MBV8648368.1 chemotaxis response regulator protein-glutamate methylesterase [Paludibacterium sp.]
MTLSAPKIRVVVVDDSALIRSLLTNIVNEADDMEVVATAADPLVARERIRETDPDVITLDVEMPRMDGIEFLRRLMRLRPTPVLMISTLTQAGSDTALTALELGAVDVMPKPDSNINASMQAYASEIRDKIRVAAAAKNRLPRAVAAKAARLPRLTSGALNPNALVFVGASTGGTEAIRAFLGSLPGECPPILIVQHMPENFTASFAARLDGLCAMHVKEAIDGEPVCRNTAYIAPGHSHMRICRGTNGWYIALDRGEPVNRHRPSVDVLFDSAAERVGRDAVAVIMTGMGKDGARGMLAMRRAGAYTLAQDEASCIVYGMPAAAVAQGGVDEICSLEQLAPRVLERLNTG